MLTDIIENDSDSPARGIVIGNIDKYVIELIRISELYKFELKIKKKSKQKTIPSLKNEINSQNDIEEQINKNEVKDLEEIKTYNITTEANFGNIEYGNVKIKIKDTKYKYKVKKPEKKNYQELWEKEGFYQEKTTQAKVRVQLWPEHLPYDHLKRKRAFLFC